jgi:hypothetical protein
MRTRLALLIVGVLVGVLATISVQITISRVGEASRETTRMTVNGVGIALPAGWTGEGFHSSATRMWVLRFGNFSFPQRPDDDTGEAARARMKAGDVLVNIIDVTATVTEKSRSSYQSSALPIVVDASQATGQEGYPKTAPSAVIRGIHVAGHDLYVSVAFGNATPSSVQVAAVEGALRALTIRPT